MERELSYIDLHDVEGVKFGLENILSLLESIGTPHNQLKVIHIAGTNGKGSVGAYLLYILADAGYKVGRLSSPAVFNEFEFASISKRKGNVIEEKYITKAYLDRKLEYIKELDLYNKPSGFEIQVAISMEYFYENKCDIVIVETGMGGKLDATNVFKETLCDVITSIGLDHTNMLGKSIEEIAKNKCGIITKKADVVTTSINNTIIDIIKKECDRRKANVYIADYNKVSEVNLKNHSNTFVYKKDRYELRQNGEYQIINAIMALEVVRVLSNKGYNISKENIDNGFKKTYIRGRFDVLDRECKIVVDGAHNVSGIQALITSLHKYFKLENKVYIFSVFKDKEYKKMIELIGKDASEIILFTNKNSRSLESSIIREELINNGVLSKNIYIYNGIGEALDKAKDIVCDNKGIIVCAGSLSFMKNLYERLN